MSKQQREQPEDWRYQEFKYDPLFIQITFGLIAIILAILVGFALFPEDMGYRSNLYTTAVGILITVSVLDLLSRRREERQQTEQLKTGLIADMGSRENTIANHAVEQLRRHGWLTDGTLRGADLWEANLEGAVLYQANMANAVLHRAKLQQSNLSEANLTGAELKDAHLGPAFLQYTNLNTADLKSTSLEGAFMLGADLSNANCAEANFQNSWLVNVNFRGAKMGAANLQDANLLGADLCGAELSLEVRVHSATNESLEIETIWARFNTNTTLPDGSMWKQDTDMRRFTDLTDMNFWRSQDDLSPAYVGKTRSQ